MSTASPPYISVIVPIYNEEANLWELTERLRRSLGPTGHPFELIFVDDGSTDGSHETLRALKSEAPEMRVILFWRNFGQSAAMTAGFDYCRGEIVVTLDGDLQNDPQDIPRMIAELEKGYDVINGWRKDRKDPFFSRRVPSILANWIIGRTTGVRLHDYGCSLKAYRREVAKQLLLYGELHRFIPVLASLYGARIAEVEVSHHPRERGRSKYGIGRTYRVMLDLILMLFFQKFATRPLQLFGLGGGLLIGIGLLIELYLTWLKLWEGQQIGARPLLLLGALLIISGLVISGMGLLAEVVMRTYYESSGKRTYVVRNILE